MLAEPAKLLKSMGRWSRRHSTYGYKYDDDGDVPIWHSSTTYEPASSCTDLMFSWRSRRAHKPGLSGTTLLALDADEDEDDPDFVASSHAFLRKFQPQYGSRMHKLHTA